VERIFYDGNCGLCHWAVKFVLPRDRAGAFRYAPLDSDTFRAQVPEPQRRALPDSMVVVTRDGRVLVRSSAVLHILRTLGGGWGAVGAVGRVVPEIIRDWTYDRVAAVRHRLFARPVDVCPVLPPEYRRRFDG
jgi:predicted DCC family thiol-disulfide oxidoreductase YuxK